MVRCLLSTFQFSSRRVRTLRFYSGKSNLWSQLPSNRPLKHRYFALRHGQSEANVAGLISSNPQVAVENHGLTEKGKSQAADAANMIDAMSDLTYVAVYSSDFLRAWETSEIFSTLLQKNTNLTVYGPVKEARLRERSYGDLDGASDDGYDGVWMQDAQDATHEIDGVESVASVAGRASSFVMELENSKEKPFVNIDDTEKLGIVLVAHGDILQILQTCFQNVNPGKHRELEHLPNAELRRLN